MVTAAGYLPIFERTRGGVVESVHFGAIAVADSHGHLVAHYGDPHTVTFLRSTAKPFQALPLLEANSPLTAKLTPAEIALICASHVGSPAHTAMARSIQQKADFTEADLLCGVHPPFDPESARGLEEREEKPSPNHHNCSGKHSGMLTLARARGWPLENYTSPTHPVQQEILAAFTAVCGLRSNQVVVGIDGCSAPNFAVPLFNTALAYARLCDPHDMPRQRSTACRRVVKAMTGHPEMVSGTGWFDTRLMEVAQGRMVVKGGAEGYTGLGLLPEHGLSSKPALGIAIKIADGDAQGRVKAAVTLEVLRQLERLSPAEIEALAEFGPQRQLRNYRDIEVGTARPAFELVRI